MGLCRYKPAEPRLVNPWIVAFVQEARWRDCDLCHFEKAIRHGLIHVLKTVVDGTRLYRWADAQPLAECL